jgi:Secretion system C-terminal sorting domain
MRILGILLLPFLLSFSLLGQQVQFNKAYPKPNQQNAFGTSVFELESGNFLAIARLNGGSYLLKTNLSGIKIWDTLINDGLYPYYSIKKESGNFLISGIVFGGKVFLKEIDSLGNTLWSKLLDQTHMPIHWLASTKLLELDSGNFLLLFTEIGDHFMLENSPTHLIAFDPFGDSIWAEVYPDPYYGISRSLDSGFVLLGAKPLDTANVLLGWDLLLTKIQDNGNVIWSKSHNLYYPWSGSFREFCGIDIMLRDSTYLIFMATGNPFEVSYSGNGLQEITDQGDTIFDWNFYNSYTFPSALDMFNPLRIIPTRDDGFVLSKWEEDSDYNQYPTMAWGSLILTKFTKTMQLEWYADISNVLAQFGANNVIQTRDGGYLITGYSNSVKLQPYFPPNSSDFGRLRLIKLDSMGNTTVGLGSNCSDEEHFNFFPNPAKNEIQIKNSEQFDEIEIIDLFGKRRSKNEFIEKVDISFLEDGVYIIKAHRKDSEGYFAKKLLIKK